MTNYNDRLVSFIWDVADLLRGPYRPPEYRKVMLPMTVLRRLDSLRSVGLGYLRVGQSTESLSGGEAQRLKLASFMSETMKGETRRLFLFDEPTTGLHHSDIEQLLKTFRDLITRGNSVVVIEHNLQLIEASDWVIDLGPDGGDQGGQLVAEGTPADVAASGCGLRSS